MTKKLFGNPGKKLKTLALVIFWIILVSFVIDGVLLILAGVNWYDRDWPLYKMFGFGGYDYRALCIVSGLLMPFIGLLSAWLSSIILYAFGELVENTTALRKTAEKTE